MGGAEKLLSSTAEPARDEEGAPSSAPVSSPVPVSVTRQRPSIEPWKVLELKKSDQPPARAPVRAHERVVHRRTYGGLALNVLFATVGVAVTAGVAWRFAHRPEGFRLASRLHALLDGRALLVGSVASLVALALTLTFSLMTLYRRPRSLGYLLAAVGTLLAGIAFMFVALTTGAHDTVGMTKDAVTLVVWSLPLVPIGLACRLFRNGWVAASDRDGLERESLLFAASVATALAFVGIELLFGAGLGHLLRMS